jgi:hypothetical protein
LRGDAYQFIHQLRKLKVKAKAEMKLKYFVSVERRAISRENPFPGIDRNFRYHILKRVSADFTTSSCE